ncbi:hypothetical protein [Crossiella sp. NPDC003009]
MIRELARALAALALLTSCTTPPPPAPTTSPPAEPLQGTSSPRSRQLQTLLHEFLRAEAPATRITSTAEAARSVLSARKHTAEAQLQTADGRAGSVRVGQAACQPGTAPRCRTKEVDGGTVVATDNTDLILIEFFRPDSTRPILVRTTGRALDTEAAIRLATGLNSAH